MGEKPPIKTKDYGEWEAKGEKISARLKPSFERLVERRVRRFSINVRNEQNLNVLRGQPCVVVANHTYPQDKMSLTTGISPDSAILSYVIRRATGKEPHFLANYGEKAAPFIKEWPEVWKNRWKRTHKGIIRGFDMLAVDTAPNFWPKTFVEDADRILTTGDPVVIYPAGPWHKDRDLIGNVKRGAAFIARRLQVPILPVYVDGALTWKPGEKTTVVVGEPFTTDSLTDSEVRKKIQQEILRLRTSNRF